MRHQLILKEERVEEDDSIFWPFEASCRCVECNLARSAPAHEDGRPGNQPRTEKENHGLRQSD